MRVTYSHSDNISQPPAASGNSCDEYPFASTLEGQQAAQDQASTRKLHDPGCVLRL